MGNIIHPLSNGCTLNAMDGRHGGFHLENYSDLPLYNIQAVSAATGVPSITLRSWERRYGAPVPKRDSKGYRLYSERDIALARWLTERVRQGVGISRAVNMLRVLESGELAAKPPITFDFDSLRSRLLDAIRNNDDAGLGRVISEALMVATIEDVAVHVLQPALYDVGTLWEMGELSANSEHVGTHVIRSHLVQLINISPPAMRSDRILVGCAPGERHDIGALMLALLLRRRGFGVLYIGANAEPEGLGRDLADQHPAAVCLSASTAEPVRALKQLYEALASEYDGILAFGGRAFNEHEDLVKSMPGIYLGTDASMAVDRLLGVVGR